MFHRTSHSNRYRRTVHRHNVAAVLSTSPQQPGVSWSSRITTPRCNGRLSHHTSHDYSAARDQLVEQYCILFMLQNKVAVVTGATRGPGKGVALALGDAGATVYVTGRQQTSRAAPAVAAPLIGTNTAAPGCVEDTAEEVTRRGGTGIPVLCDHTNVDQVAALLKRVRQEQHGQLDVLVNTAWGGNEWDVTQTPPFWELPLQDHWRNMFDAGVSAAMTSQQAAAIMVVQQQGLIVNVTFWDDDKYTGHMMYDLAKAALNRMGFSMSHDLVPHKVAVLALTPGWMRTERVLAQSGCSTGTKHMYSTSQTLSYTNTASTTAAAGKPTLAAGNT